MEYRVELDVYNGPLDLLLYLLKRDELDIYDIPISRILDAYMQHVELMRDPRFEIVLDINTAGDFLVMAATLMEIKSAMLLPRLEEQPKDGQRSAAQDLTDPRYELVQKLLEYKRFKDTAVLLDRQHERHEARFPRIPAKPDGAVDEPPPVDMEEVQVWDLLSAFTKLMTETGFRKPRFHEVTYDDTPIDLHAADIEDRLGREGQLTLRKLIEGRTSRSEMIGLFLALLELIRQKKILVTQGDDLTDLVIDPAPEEHRKTYEHASLSLSDADETTPEEDATGGEDDESLAEIRQRRKQEKGERKKRGGSNPFAKKATSVAADLSDGPGEAAVKLDELSVDATGAPKTISGD